MNLGHQLGVAIRERVREPSPARSNAIGYWHQLGQLTYQRVRTVVEALDPVRYEMWHTQDDERTCPTCGQLNGRIWQEGEGFSPPVHDNCRCERVYHHTEFSRRLIEQWQDVAVPTFSWRWRTR